MKKIGLCMTAVLLPLLAVVGCSNASNGQNGSAADLGKQEQAVLTDTLAAGLSFTAAREEKDGSILTDVYYYDFAADSLSKIYTRPDEAQYPLMVYDKKNEQVYYSKSLNGHKTVGGDLGDDLYVHDLKHNTDTQLTDMFWAINDIIPMDEQIFMAACIHDTIQPVYFHKNDQSVVNDAFDNDFMISYTGRCLDDGCVYAAGYSDQAWRAIAEDVYASPDYTLYQLKGDTLTKVIQTDKQVIFSFGVNAEGILYVTADNEYEPHYILNFYEFSTQKSQQLSKDLMEEIGKIVYLDDTNQVYSIVHTQQSTYQLCKTKLSDGSTTTLFETDGKQAINNAQAVPAA